MNIYKILNVVCWGVLGISAARIKMKILHWFILLIIIALISATTTIIAVENITVGGIVCL